MVFRSSAEQGSAKFRWRHPQRVLMLWVWEEQSDAGRERQGVTGLAAPVRRLSGILGMLGPDKVVSQEDPGPQPHCQSLSLEPGSRY